MKLLPPHRFAATSSPRLNPAAPPPRPAAPLVSQMDFIDKPHVTVLLNGATASFQQMAFQKQAKLSIYLPLGNDQIGFKQLLPHLLLKGSYRTRALLEAATAQGITAAAESTPDKLVLSFNAPSGREADMARLALRLLSAPDLDAPSFALAREEAVERIRKAQVEPEVRLNEAVRQRLYGPQHPYALDGSTQMANIARQQPEVILAEYRRLLQSPQRLHLEMISSQPPQAQLLTIQRAIRERGWFRPAYPQPATASLTPPMSRRTGQETLLLPNPHVKRAYISRVWRAPAIGEPDHLPFQLLLLLLASRTNGFHYDLRNREGLVYSVRQQYAPAQQGGDFLLNLQVDFDEISEALSTLDRTIQRFLAAPSPPMELAQAKRKFLLGLRDKMQTPAGLHAFNQPWLLNNASPLPPGEMEARINALRADELQALARRIFHPTVGHQVTGIAAPPAILQALAANRPLT
jgi:predicted Zn-dependent peptidase